MRYYKIKTQKNKTVCGKTRKTRKTRKIRIRRRYGSGPKVNRDYIRKKKAEERDEEAKLLTQWKEEEKQDQRNLDLHNEKKKREWLKRHFRNPKASNLTEKEKAVELLHQKILEKTRRDELDRSNYDNAMRASVHSLLENESGKHYTLGRQTDHSTTFIDTHGISIGLDEEKEDDSGYGFYAHDFRGGKTNKKKINKNYNKN